ncbi:MAG TPA: hypothetical protein VIX63_18325 [Vicinamibacterales bacterium]
MTQPVLLGGLFIGVLSALPLISVANCCCLWIVCGGLLTARLAYQDTTRPLTPGRGAFLGLMAGIVGAFVWLVAALALDVVIAPLQERMIAEMLRNAQDMPPNARAWVEMVAGRADSPLRFVAGFAFQLCGAIFAALGGLLGATFFRRDVPPALGGDPMAPPPLPPT